MSSPGLRPAHGVGVVVADQEESPRVYLAHLPDGPLVVLEGASAVIWRVATTCAADDLVLGVAGATGAPADDIAGDVERFVEELIARGFLDTAEGATN